MVNTSLVKSKVLDKTPIYAKISKSYFISRFLSSSSMFICTNSRMNSAQHIYHVYLKLNKIFIFALTKLSIFLALFPSPHLRKEPHLLSSKFSFCLFLFFLCVFLLSVCFVDICKNGNRSRFVWKWKWIKKNLYKIPLVLEEEMGFVWNLQINVSRLRDGQARWQ